MVKGVSMAGVESDTVVVLVDSGRPRKRKVKMEDVKGWPWQDKKRQDGERGKITLRSS
jgi:hypothetical protein